MINNYACMFDANIKCWSLIMSNEFFLKKVEKQKQVKKRLGDT